jgi:DNA-binding helix-hairpin-helix protein with protein kinase domain
MSGISHASLTEVIRLIHRTFHTSRLDLIRLGQRVGIGAEGEVYETQNCDNLVAKIYHEPPSPDKAEKLVALSRLGANRLFNLSAWPIDVLRDASSGDIVGFVMKKITGAEEVHALHSPKSRLLKFPEASWSFLIYVAANIARAVAAIHEHGFVIGDLNPKNILVTRKATVYLLDVDSFQVSVDGRTYRCDAGFAEYTPSELQGVAFRDVDRAQEHDCFGLAVVIFQLLFMGRHPFSGRYLGAGEMPLERAIRESRFAYGADAEARKMRQPPGTLALDSLPSVIVELFRRAFLTNDRPQPREWVESLDALAKSLKNCALHSGHYFYKELRECPWCGIETHARVRLFNFLLPVGDSQRGHFRLDEIWKEIVSVKPPITNPTSLNRMMEAPNPSADVMEAVGERKSRLIAAILFSIIPSFGVALTPPVIFLSDFTFSFVLLLPVVAIAWMISGAERIERDNLQTLFQSQQPVPDDSLARKVRSRLLQAEETVWRLQEQYDLEAGNKRWGVKLDELRTKKETYERLAEIRDLKTEALRLHLERELSGGANNLRHVKKETETNRKNLQSALMEAWRELALAERDWRAVVERPSFKPVLLALLIAFFIGMMMNPGGTM